MKNYEKRLRKLEDVLIPPSRRRGELRIEDMTDEELEDEIRRSTGFRGELTYEELEAIVGAGTIDDIRSGRSRGTDRRGSEDDC